MKSISLQEVGDVTQNQEGKMLLDSGATHALRRAAAWLEREEATATVVALARGTTSKLRLKHGTTTLLPTPQDDSFGNGIVPITKLGYEVAWTGGDFQLRGRDAKNLDVEVVNGCPLIDCELGMKLINELEHESSVSLARMAIKAILQQPDLVTKFPNLDPTVLLMVLLKREYRISRSS